MYGSGLPTFIGHDRDTDKEAIRAFVNASIEFLEEAGSPDELISRKEYLAFRLEKISEVTRVSNFEDCDEII
jgi:hypothetical protein